MAKARTKDSMSAFSKLTRVVDGEARIVAEPPLIVPIDDLPQAEGIGRDEMFDRLHELLRSYRETLEHDRRVLVEEFRLVDFARKVVGVGSVGTRAWIALMLGPRRPGPAVPADEGGRVLGARGVPRRRASSTTTASGSSPDSG